MGLLMLGLITVSLISAAVIDRLDRNGHPAPAVLVGFAAVSAVLVVVVAALNAL